MAKFDLVGHMLSLAGKCPVTGHYHKPCIYTQKFQKLIKFYVHINLIFPCQVTYMKALPGYAVYKLYKQKHSKQNN